MTDRVTVRTLGPLGLAGRQGAVDVPGTLRVLPAFPSIKHLPSRLARLRELDGRAAVRVRGQGTEFDSLREYVSGDDVRSVDWRASARSRSVVVRTWQPERDRRLVLVLDTGRTSAGRVDDAPRLDAAMDAALLLATLASRAGDRVSFVAGDLGVRSRLQGSHRRDGVERPAGRHGRPAAGAGRDQLAQAGRRGRLAGTAAGARRTADGAGALGRAERAAARSSGRSPRATGCCWRRCATRRSTGSRGTAATPGRRTPQRPPSRQPPNGTAPRACSPPWGWRFSTRMPTSCRCAWPTTTSR